MPINLFASRIRRLSGILLGLMILSIVALPSDVSGQVPCSPSLLPPNEGKALLRMIPQALSARRIGGKLSVVDWSPGSSYRTESFYLYELLSTKSPETTPLDNGVLGYFGVNKRTGQVVELNSDRPFVEGTELSQLQVRFRTEHCIDEDLVAKDAALPLEK